MRVLQTVCAWATFKLQLTFWAVPVHVLGLLFSPLSASIPAWLWFQLCRFCFPCPPESRMWIRWFVVRAQQQCPCFTGWHRLWLTVSSSTAVSHRARCWLAVVQPECSPSSGDGFQLWCSSCTHQKADGGARGWGLDFSLLIVSEFSVDGKTSSLKEIQLHLFLYLFKTLLFLSCISTGSSIFFHFTDSTVFVELQINLSNTCSPKMRGEN